MHKTLQCFPMQLDWPHISLNPAPTYVSNLISSTCLLTHNTPATVPSSFPVQGLCTCSSPYFGKSPPKSLWLAPSCPSALYTCCLLLVSNMDKVLAQIKLMSSPQPLLPYSQTYSITPPGLLSSEHTRLSKLFISLLSVCFSRKTLGPGQQVKPGEREIRTGSSRAKLMSIVT